MPHCTNYFRFVQTAACVIFYGPLSNFTQLKPCQSPAAGNFYNRGGQSLQRKSHMWKFKNWWRATNSVWGVNANLVNQLSFYQIIKTNTTLHDLQFFRDFTSIGYTVDFHFINTLLTTLLLTWYHDFRNFITEKWIREKRALSLFF